jgi:hypothetical protein
LQAVGPRLLGNCHSLKSVNLIARFRSKCWRRDQSPPTSHAGKASGYSSRRHIAPVSAPICAVEPQCNGNPRTISDRARSVLSGREIVVTVRDRARPMQRIVAPALRFDRTFACTLVVFFGKRKPIPMLAHPVFP